MTIILRIEKDEPLTFDEVDGNFTDLDATKSDVGHTHVPTEIVGSTAAGRAMLTAADATAQTALLDTATTSLKGLLSSADKTKLDAITGTNTGDETAAGILTKIKTVDGDGTGLDADKLDGLDATAFSLASHTQLAATISDSTSAGRTLLTAASAQAQRTALSVYAVYTRAAFVTAVAGGFLGTAGTSITVEGLAYRWSAGATSIPDLAGLVPAGEVSPGHFGAVGDGSTNVTSALQAAIDMLAAAGGGEIVFPPGAFMVSTLTIKTGVTLRGSGVNTTIIKKIASTDGPVITTADFATKSAANTINANDDHDFTIRDLTVDGNRSSQSAGANVDLQNGLSLWAYRYSIRDVLVKNVYGNGVRVEWGEYGDFAMECEVSGLKIDTCGRHGLWFDGPHDSHFDHVTIIDAGQETDNTYSGIYIVGQGNGRFFNAHPWHRSTATNRMKHALYNNGGACEFVNCHFEGARRLVYSLAYNASFVSCFIYAPSSTDPMVTLAGVGVSMSSTNIMTAGGTAGGVPIQIGVSGVLALFGSSIEANLNSSAAYGVNFDNDSGANNISVTVSGTSDTVSLFTGTRQNTTIFEGVRNNGGGALNQHITRAFDGTFTPTVQFATPGDFSPTYTVQTGRYMKIGGLCWFSILLTFSTNAYTTASGAFTVGGLPFTASATGAASHGRLQQCTVTGASTGAYVVSWTTTIGLTENVSNSNLTYWGTTQVPASKTNVIIELTGCYPCAA